MVSYTTTMTLTNEGKKRFLLKALQKDTTNGFKVAIGNGTTPPTENDTSLENQLYAIEPIYIEIIDNIGYISAFFDTTYIGDVSEIGLLDTKDDMLIGRTVLSDYITKNDDNTLTIDIQIEL